MVAGCSHGGQNQWHRNKRTENAKEAVLGTYLELLFSRSRFEPYQEQIGCFIGATEGQLGIHPQDTLRSLRQLQRHVLMAIPFDLTNYAH